MLAEGVGDLSGGKGRGVEERKGSVGGAKVI